MPCFGRSLDLHSQPRSHSCHFRREDGKHRCHIDELDHVEYAMVDVHLSNGHCLGLEGCRTLLDMIRNLVLMFGYQLVLGSQPKHKESIFFINFIKMFDFKFLFQIKNLTKVILKFFIKQSIKTAAKCLPQGSVGRRSWLNLESIAMSDRVLGLQQPIYDLERRFEATNWLDNRCSILGYDHASRKWVLDNRLRMGYVPMFGSHKRQAW